MVIKRDGSWVHEGKPIRRPAMVQLFASVLKLEGDAYFLVTPVEKVGIVVEDCPFVVTEMEVETGSGQQVLRFTTNTGDELVAGTEHPLSFQTEPGSDEPHPTILVRSGMPGLISRAVFYRLVELAEPRAGETGEALGIYSEGEFFSLREFSTS